jgi:uncharacterized protein YcbX
LKKVETMAEICVKEIYLFPVKSLSGIKLDKCVVTKLGIAHPEVPEVVDRCFKNELIFLYLQ